jgi:hypothetical protein
VFDVPQALDSDAFELEGQKLVVIDDGFTDTDHSTLSGTHLLSRRD